MVCPNIKYGNSFGKKGGQKKIFLMLAAVSILAVGCNRQADSPAPPTIQNYNYSHSLQIGNVNLMVEIASTKAQMERGLSDRISMDENQGMLFDFSAGGGSQLKAEQPLAGAKISGGGDAATPAFWMKDMKFNLDFIWIAGGKIVGITPNVAHPNFPSDPLPTYSPPEPVNQVLEVNAGWAERNSVHVGDGVILVN